VKFLTQNQSKNSHFPAQPKPNSAESATLYETLVQFGKDCDEGNYPEQPFEVCLHRARVANRQDYQDFVEKVLPFLIEKHWLEEPAAIENALNLFKKHDSWQDMEAFGKFYGKIIPELEKISSTSLIGQEWKEETLRVMKERARETERSLDFLIPAPMGDDRVGNRSFHRLVLDIAKAAFEKSQTFTEYRER